MLYLNLELKSSTFNRRVQAIAKATGIVIDRSWFTHLPLRGKMANMRLDDVITRFVRLAMHFKAGVVVADPVYKMNVEGGEENSAGVQTLFFNQLDRITTEAEATLILNDHFGKGNQSEKDPLDAIRGSSAKGGDVDAAMILRKHEVDGCFRVDMIHRELPPVDPFCIGWNYPLMELRPDLNADAMRKAKGGRKRAHNPGDLLAAIMVNTAENPVSITAWAETVGVARTTLVEYLPEMRRMAWIQTVGEGGSARQAITPEGQRIARCKEATK